MTHYHAAVWIDHHEAHVVEFGTSGQSSETVKSRHPVKRRHVKAGSLSSWRAKEDPDYFNDVAGALEGVGEILVVGPADAKFAFFKHLQAKHPALAAKVVGIETVDHPSNGELVNYAKNYFHKVERMLPQLG
ncbi:MAG: translational machinery protein [Parvibaculum sp.]|uniref:translational machinery protein n=1 Tax=Parvibaculum sp. TaxID=2024848 RepID=UPI0025FB15A5|nr:translational machinery protein [Parvibaculum sp.]MCE9650093.1 translational machinery protein [Parvibaculum sp.]